MRLECLVMSESKEKIKSNYKDMMKGLRNHHEIDPNGQSENI